MAKQLFNEAERYLLTNWQEAVQVEESLGAVREQYKDLIQGVADAARERYGLDAAGIWVTQRWSDGQFALGRKEWGGKDGWPPGIWFWHIRLEKMLSEEEDAPVAYLRLGDGRKPPLDLVQATRCIAAEAKKILTADELAAADMTEYEPGSTCQLDLPPRPQLLAMLRDGDGEQFKACLLGKIDTLAKFIPVLNDLFLHHKAKAE
jgi:hypothetical protein